MKQSGSDVVSAGIDELVSRLRQDGVEAGETEAEAILADARQQAAALLADARQQADKLIAEAK
ncbi:HrpE/YscL family type III secretion apparatus protein, partial [Anaerobacillus sp. 1_MG-2023]